MRPMIINALLFQIGWLICVLAGANHLPWLGTLTALLIVARHVATAADPSRESLLLLVAGGIGAAWDSFLVYSGWLHYPSGMFIEGAAPHWIVAMWLLFTTTLNVSLRWLRDRPLLSAMLGAVSGPAAYYAGYRLGGVDVLDPVAAYSALAVGWSIMMPLLMQVSKTLDGVKPQPSAARLAGCNANV